MNDEQYLTYCRQLLSEFAQGFERRTRSLEEGDSLQELAAAFVELASGKRDLYSDGQTLVARLFTTYPDFAPTFPRDLLWFLGGECLHFMPDDEIEQHQQLTDLRAEAAARGETLDLIAARAKLLKLQ
ncbi:MAG: PA2817 family protein [Halieaceae bacterium]